jgi:two-component system nitrogen regulation sensor histidine kinase NtrY
MVFKTHSAGLIIRIIFLLINVFLTGFTASMIGEKDLFFLPLTLFLILIIQTIEFIYFSTRIKRELARFIENLRKADFAIKFNDRFSGNPYKNLYEIFNEISDYITNIKLEKEAQFNYLQTVISHMMIGIICLKDEKEIVMINDPALKILGINKTASWQEIINQLPDFTGQIDAMSGSTSKLIEINLRNDIVKLSVKVSNLIILGEEFRIITFQDIRTEIEQKEIEAWQQLIRILRHEIMNSVTPISSMTETVLMLVEDQLGSTKKAADLTNNDVADIRVSARTIHERSEGLYDFVEKYREITRIPDPEMTEINVRDMIDRISKLMEIEFDRNGVQLMTEYKNPSLTISADNSQIEQVLINLIKNSLQALDQTEDKKLKIIAESTPSYQLIKVIDNGCGIEEKDMNEIFVPFYSTRENGSGIGLSLSKQIMLRHGGNISVNSKPGKETCFSLIFPNISQGMTISHTLTD